MYNYLERAQKPVFIKFTLPHDSGVGYEPVSVVGGGISLDWELRMVCRDSEGWQFPLLTYKRDLNLVVEVYSSCGRFHSRNTCLED